jgi:murein DD-endopeptidase MepM/ murein hydrolase activator NlpD
LDEKTILPPINYDGKVVGQRLQQLRLDANYSLDDVADILGVEASDIQTWESGDIYLLDTLQRLAQFYNTTPTLLLLEKHKSSTPSAIKKPAKYKKSRHKLFIKIGTIAVSIALICACTLGFIISNFASTQNFTANGYNGTGKQNPFTSDIYSSKVNFTNPIIGGTIYADNGFSNIYFDEESQTYLTHNGVDILADENTPIYASAGGTVTYISGSSLIIEHDNGYCTIYTFVNIAEDIALDKTIEQGTLIGNLSGYSTTENSLPCHLHFCIVKDSNYVDPAKFLN